MGAPRFDLWSARLCYVRHQFAFFTTQDVEKQWGDDWNDAPYEHNAGDPYLWGKYDEERGVPEWRVVRVAYEGPWETPEDRAPNGNSWYSVEQINAKQVAWLIPDRYDASKRPAIHAGTRLLEFMTTILAHGGQVYLPSFLCSAAHSASLPPSRPTDHLSEEI